MKKKPKLPRNWLAVSAHNMRSSGPHGDTKYSRKIKHKNKRD